MPSPGRLSFEDRWQLLARQVFTTALDLVFPPVCVGCERVGSFLCERCIAALKPARERYVPELEGIQVRASFEGAVREALHGLKYERQRRLAEPLGKLL
ncbi:MAG: hypothetical protein JXA10_00150, partial [Anaerolineae bacterium]|nr:hypothetical protein [Anaerolineae bacterium]